MLKTIDPLCSNLEIRKKLSPEELMMIKRSLLNNMGPNETWTGVGTNKQLAYATHGMVRFFGKFPPPIASFLIEKYTKPGQRVLDPMCGSGTTGVECLLKNRKCELRDVNPLMLLLAAGKSTKLGQKKF